MQGGLCVCTSVYPHELKKSKLKTCAILPKFLTSLFSHDKIKTMTEHQEITVCRIHLNSEFSSNALYFSLQNPTKCSSSTTNPQEPCCKSRYRSVQTLLNQKPMSIPFTVIYNILFYLVLGCKEYNQNELWGVFTFYWLFRFNMHSQTHSSYKFCYIHSILVTRTFSSVLLKVLHEYHLLLLTLHLDSFLLLSLISFFLPLIVLHSILLC